MTKLFLQSFTITFLLFLSGAGARADTILFTDVFAPTGTGPGTNWTSLTVGYPDLATARILDGTRSVLHMQSSNLTPAQPRGIQTAKVISLIPVTNGLHLHVDLGFQPRSGGTNSSVTLQLTGAQGSLQLATQDGLLRRAATSGNGSGGAFSANSGSYVYSDLTYYHFTVDIFANGTTVSLLSDDEQTLLWQSTTTGLVLTDFGGSLNLPSA